MPRSPAPWQEQYFRDLSDRAEEEAQRRREKARLSGTTRETYEAFHDLSHLALPKHLADRKGGRKWTSETSMKRPVSWKWME